jgi:hypothetical protein
LNDGDKNIVVDDDAFIHFAGDDDQDCGLLP